MNIYTSYYGNYRNFGDLIPISIALYPSKYFKCITLKDLSPTKEILNLKNNEDEYIKEYNKLLNKIDATYIYNKIRILSKNKDVVLLCYEKPPQFCHRHLVAKWLKQKLNIEVSEIKYKITK